MKRLLRAFLWWCLRVNSQLVIAMGRLCYGLEVHGSRHLPSTGPLILVGRHGSRIELFILAFFCSVLKEFHGVAAGPVVVNTRLFTWLSRELGLFPGFKEKGLSAGALLETYKLLKQGKIILMGGDGEVPWDGRPLPLRPGAAWLALRVRAPVIVFLLQGDYDIWPRWAARPHLTGKMVLKIGPPFYLCDAPCDRVTGGMIQEANRRLLGEMEKLAQSRAESATGGENT